MALSSPPAKSDSPDAAAAALAPRERWTSAGRSAALATAATVFAFASTFVQQVLYARVLGANAETDALAAALAWAVGTTGLVGTTLASVVLPPYLRALRTDPARARIVFRTANSLALAGGVALAGTTFVAAPVLAVLLLPGASSEVQDRLGELLKTTAPLHLLWIGVWSLMALANARERFVAAAASMVLPSLPVIAVLASPSPNVDQVGASYVAGACLQLAALVGSVWQWKGDLVPGFAVAASRSLSGRLIPIGLAFALINAAGLAIRAIASLGGAGDVAIADYATRLTTTFEQVALSGTLAVLFTVWSSEASLANAKGRVPIAPALRLAVGFAVLFGMMLALFAPDLVEILYGGGQFTDSDVAATARYIRWMSLGLTAHVVLMVALRAVLARGATWHVAFMGMVTITTTIVVGLVLHPSLGLDAAAVAYSVSWIATLAVAIGWISRSLADPLRLWGQLGRAAVTGASATVAGAAVLVSLPGSDALRLALSAGAFATAALIAGHLLAVSFIESIVLGIMSLARRILRRSDGGSRRTER